MHGSEDRHAKFTLSADKLRQQFYNKSKIGKCLKLKTSSWSYQNITHLWHLIVFLLEMVYPATFWKDYMYQVIFISWHIQNITCNLTYPKIIITTLQYNGVKYNVDGHPSSLLAHLKIFDYLQLLLQCLPLEVFLEVDRHHCNLSLLSRSSKLSRSSSL